MQFHSFNFISSNKILQTICENPVNLSGYICLCSGELWIFHSNLNLEPLNTFSEFEIRKDVFNKQKHINYLDFIRQTISKILQHFYPKLPRRAICQDKKKKKVSVLIRSCSFSLLATGQ